MRQRDNGNCHSLEGVTHRGAATLESSQAAYRKPTTLSHMTQQRATFLVNEWKTLYIHAHMSEKTF